MSGGSLLIAYHGVSAGVGLWLVGPSDGREHDQYPALGPG